MTFSFNGSLGVSKSILNRALILKSYFSELHIEGSSSCQDVRDLQNALSQLEQSDFEIAEGGTTFRFLTLRLSRQTGEFRIRTSARLMARPQEELIEILSQLGVEAEKHPWGFIIRGTGWKKPSSPLKVNRSRSSQFLTGVVLNSPGLDFPLEIEAQGEALSEDYFKMTLQMTEELGLEYTYDQNRLVLQPWNRLKRHQYLVGADLSSAFSLACFAAANGELNIRNIFKPDLQPDFKFVSAFEDMNIPAEAKGETLRVSRSTQPLPAVLNLSSAPDLFPMMACLCSQIAGTSVLAGAPQLKFKESDRLKKVFELFDLAGVSYEKMPDGIKVRGPAMPHAQEFEFDPDEDHRMAMAAAFLKFVGWKIKIKNPQVVDKSFPEFWAVTGVFP